MLLPSFLFKNLWTFFTMGELMGYPDILTSNYFINYLQDWTALYKRYKRGDGETFYNNFVSIL